MRLRRSISDTSGGSCRLAVHPKVTKAHQVSKQYTSSTSIAIDYGAACTSQPPVFCLHNPIFYPKPTMVHKILFWSGFGTHHPPNFPNTSNPILTTTNHYRPRSPLLATRHRNASLLQQRIPLGVAPLRRRGRKFRILVDRGREQTDENIGGEAE